MQKWKVLSSEIITDNPWIKLYKDRCETETGYVVDDYYWFESGNFTSVLGVTEDGKAVLVEQYRHGVKDITLEFPAGHIDEGEDPIDTGLRELKEETGYTAEDAIFIKEMYVSTGFTSKKGYLVFARNLKNTGKQELDNSENINIKLFDFDKLIDLVKDNTVKGSFGTTGILLAQYYRDWFFGK